MKKAEGKREEGRAGKKERREEGRERNRKYTRSVEGEKSFSCRQGEVQYKM